MLLQYLQLNQMHTLLCCVCCWAMFLTRTIYNKLGNWKLVLPNCATRFTTKLDQMHTRTKGPSNPIVSGCCPKATATGGRDECNGRRLWQALLTILLVTVSGCYSCQGLRSLSGRCSCHSLRSLPGLLSCALGWFVFLLFVLMKMWNTMCATYGASPFCHKCQLELALRYYIDN